MQIALIVYRLAIACWLGGVAMFTTVLTPTIFKAFPRDVAGGIVGVLVPGYFRWGMVCGALALLSVRAQEPQAVGISQVVEHWLPWQGDSLTTTNTEDQWTLHNLDYLRSKQA